MSIHLHPPNRRHQWLLAVVVFVSIGACHCMRVEHLRDLNRDSSSITIEWSLSSGASGNGIASDTSSSSTDDGGGGGAGGGGSMSSSETDWIGFKIKYFTDKLQYTPILLKNANLRRFRLDNLKSNTEYKIQVSAYNRFNGEGPASNLLVVRTFETGLSLSSFHIPLVLEPTSRTWQNRSIPFRLLPIRQHFITFKNDTISTES